MDRGGLFCFFLSRRQHQQHPLLLLLLAPWSL